MDCIKQNLPEQIVNLIETILNRIINYSQKNISNLSLLENKILSINEYTINILTSPKQQSRNGQKTPKNISNDYSSVSFYSKTQTPNNTNNYKSLSLNHYMITKLKRKLKQEHEKKKIIELGYLEKIIILKNQLNKYQSENLGKVLDQTNDISEYKIVLRKENKSAKSNRTKNIQKINNILESNNNSKDNSSNILRNNTTTNFSVQNNRTKNINPKKTNAKNLSNVNYFFRIPRNMQSKNRTFKNYYLRYDLNEIKHEVEEGKRKIKFLREFTQK